MEDPGWPAVASWNAGGRAPVVLVCEHASAFIPPALNGLGLDATARVSHVAWDIGALDVARRLSAVLDAPLVAGQVSRLVYDCNRPPEAAGAIPERSEIYDIAGNRDLSDDARAARVRAIHDPFHAAVAATLDRQEARCGKVALVTVHSFTPVFFGKRRELDLGYLYHETGAIAEVAVAVEAGRGRYTAAVNAPYSIADGVTYTLARHAEGKGRDSVMIEIRNDLIETEAGAEAMADHLAGTLAQAMSMNGQGAPA
ncbi:N-formylglutamate amidohydrolase [Mesobacterium pallidum]|uniref:N-formylglutamate amidohydrolase n=1 Tax=Mesobacterium pallidum TaxID=2872037 RepID=UPI001EE226FF|nr:N-formylglutamate amidohydrolase [Mesobacterium pallidum]